MKTIILIPTYNERGNITDILTRVRANATKAAIMVIDDGSPDGTADVVRDIMNGDTGVILFARERKEGLGKAYVAALKKVREMPDIEQIITMDADGSHDPSYLPIMLERSKSFDLVVGSRYVKGGGVENWAWYRKLLSECGNLYSRIICRTGIHDLTAGFVCFNRRVLKSLNLESFEASGYAYQMEFKYRCVRSGFTFSEIPIIFKERKIGSSKISLSIIIGGLIMPLRLIFRNP